MDTVEEYFSGAECRREESIDYFYTVDMFVPKHNLIVEVQGPYHINGISKVRKKDKSRTRLLKALGYKVCEVETREFMGLRQ